MRTDKNIVERDLEYITGSLAKEINQIAGKSILLTGAGGFLGYYLTLSLVRLNQKLTSKQKFKINLLDNFNRGVPTWLDGLRENPDVNIGKGDISSFPLGIWGPFDYVLHAASIASPVLYRRYPLETIQANVDGLQKLLDCCVGQQERNHSIQGFLFFSSSEIYGDPESKYIPTPETYPGRVSSTGPRACYDESKRFGETLCVNYWKVHGLPTKIVRPFNNFGPGMSLEDGRAPADFANDILNGRDMVLYSNGSPTRTFCYVADAIIGYFKVLVSGRSGEAYNIGVDSPEVSMGEFARIMAETARESLKYSGKIILKKHKDSNYLTHNPQRRCPSIAKARQELGYSPRVSLQQGLEQTLEWYRDNF